MLTVSFDQKKLPDDPKMKLLEIIKILLHYRSFFMFICIKDQIDLGHISSLKMALNLWELVVSQNSWF